LVVSGNPTCDADDEDNYNDDISDNDESDGQSNLWVSLSGQVFRRVYPTIDLRPRPKT